MNQLMELGLTHSPPPVWEPAFADNSWRSQARSLYSSTASTETIDLSGDTAIWVVEAAQKLETLGRLQVDWDSYGGLPLRPGAKRLTLRVLEWLRKDELPVPAVVLGPAGTVQLEWRAKGKELEVELRDNETIEYVKVSPTGEIEEGEATSDLSRKLHDLTNWLRHS